ncbi:MAG: S8 family peptidase [Bacteroidetes bacterium]|nr:S8 family peptidase [Bacteroidota bacterium]
MKTIFKVILTVLIFNQVFSYQKDISKYNKSKLDSRLVLFFDKTISTSQESSEPNHSRIKSIDKNEIGEKLYEVIVYLNSEEGINDALLNGIKINSINTIEKTFYTARYSLSEISLISQLPTTKFIEPPRRYKSKLNASIVEIKANLVHSGQVNNTQYKGDGILIGVLDTGIDWKHLDFRSDTDTTKSRILFIWDQGILTGTKPAGFNYGSEYTQAQINDELDGTPTNVVQQKDSDGHGTHVASSAAGDGSSYATTKYIGVAPKSDLIIVNGDNGSGFTSNKIIDAITYIRTKAEAAGKPFVINLSLGGHDGSHDGTHAEELKIDSELGKAGRAIVIAAGNEGEDLIHHDSLIASGSVETEFTVYQYTPETGTNNDYVLFSIWYPKQFLLNITVTTPKGTVVTANHGLQTTNQTSTNEGYVKISNANGGPNPTNDTKECWIEIIDSDAGKPPGVGVWKLTFTLASGSPTGATYDAWISDFGNDEDMWVEFTKGSQRRKLVAMPGTSNKAITVGAYVTKWSWSSSNGNNYNYNGTTRLNNYSLFSSPGPTRTAGQKPDISAPGQGIAASRASDASFEAPYIVTGGKHVIEQGTSMAAPQVAGAVALMLQAKPALTSDQIKALLKTTARTDSYTGSVWNSQWGAGKIDVLAAMNKTVGIKKLSDYLPNKIELSQNFPNPFNPTTKINFLINSNSNTKLIIYDILGREVDILVNEKLNSGSYSVDWNASKFSSGVYYYKLQSNNKSEIRKMVLMK